MSKFMHRKRLKPDKFFIKAFIGFTTVIASAFAIPSLAAVYKVTAPDGSILFTDNPQNYHNNIDMHIEPMNVPPSATVASSAISPQVATGLPVSTAKESNSSVIRSINDTEYQIKIISPEHEQVFRRPAGQVDIDVEITPTPQSGDLVNVLLDGQSIGNTTSITIPTLDMTPGRHTLSVEIINAKDNTISGKSIEFYIIQNTLALQRKRQLAERLKAYNDLPWYTKVYLKLRQDELHQDDKNIDIQGQTSSSFTGGGSSSAF